jgi:hypothetical protein
MLQMRSLGVLLAVGLLSGVTACGGSGKSTGSASHPYSHTATTAAATTSAAVGVKSGSPSGTSLHIPKVLATPNDLKEPGLDIPASPQDRPRYGFYGHPAGVSDRRAIVALVKRYYALAAAGNGKGACSMLIPGLTKSLPVEYGQLGASYLRGAKTCEAVLSRLFKHSHHELSVPVAVVGVFIKGEDAYSPIVSSKMPTSIITLKHEHGVWVISKPLGGRVESAFLSRHEQSRDK